MDATLDREEIGAGNDGPAPDDGDTRDGRADRSRRSDAARRDTIDAVRRETAAAQALLAAFRAETQGDASLRQSLVEGETSLPEAVETALAARDEAVRMVALIADRMGELAARRDRYATRADRIEAAVRAAMDQLGLRRVETPIGTAFLSGRQPRLEIDDPTGLPIEFLKRRLDVDVKKLRQAIEAGVAVEGARLVAQPDGLNIRTR